MFFAVTVAIITLFVLTVFAFLAQRLLILLILLILLRGQNLLNLIVSIFACFFTHILFALFHSISALFLYSLHLLFLGIGEVEACKRTEFGILVIAVFAVALCAALVLVALGLLGAVAMRYDVWRPTLSWRLSVLFQ